MVDFFGKTLAQQSQLAAVVPGFSCKHRSLASQRRRARQNVFRRTHCDAEAVKTQDSGRQAPTWKSSFRERYALGRHIGSGSYGVVHVCIDEVTKQKAAVKILPKVRSKQLPQKTLRKLEREVTLMARVSRQSSGITPLIDVYEDKNYVYIVMGLNEGGDLEELLETYGPFSERATAAVIYECLKIISVCHANGVLLGDIKPANFMLRQRYRDPLKALESEHLGEGFLTAVDFGCSQAVGPTPLARRTGTPVYMSPETFRREYHLEADLWSLGMMMYQLIAGRFPFWASIEQCRTRSLEEVMKAVIMEDIPVDYGPWLSVSPEGLSLLQGLLTRDPTQRLTAVEALQHPWFQRHFAGGAEENQSSRRNNIVPLMPASPRGTSSEAGVLRSTLM
ncbi:Calcium-dependent protein kinase 17 [Coccomyxa sp. Obi]|nr:Calcium-dependent protein kinase 17 [Coccomyxa sp. Obi]